MRQVTVMVFILSLGWFAIYLAKPPRAASGVILPERFSVSRALEHIDVIAREPHVRGSAANARVRDYLLSELRALKYEATVEKSSSVRDSGIRGAPIENIVARKVGTANTRAVLVCAHYDSVVGAPGASDDGAAVASILETLRALNHDTALRNDLIVLLTDGEEEGQIGARAFTSEHPWMKDIGIVFNFDARGTCGASIMFETSKGDLGLIREFDRAVPDIRSTSLSTFVYERMPNGTDFTNFKRAGVPGFNFAFIEGPEHYHQPTDIPENLNRNTLQHTGHNMLFLLRHFGNVVLPIPPSENAVYFNALGSWFICYPQRWVPPLTGFLAALSFITLFIFWRTDITRAGRVGISLIALTCCLSLAVILPSALNFLLLARESMGSVVVLTAIFTWFCSGSLERWCNTTENMAAAFIYWSVFAIVSGFLVPSGSYVFLWPAVAGWLGLLVCFYLIRRLSANNKRSWFASAVILSGPLCAIVLWSPLCRIVYIALPSSLPAIAAFTVMFFWPLKAAIIALTGGQGNGMSDGGYSQSVRLTTAGG